jgi:hypothetical protein
VARAARNAPLIANIALHQLKRASLMSIPGEATYRQQFGEYRYLRQVISELITFAVKRSASALVEQFFHDPLKRMPISMNRPCFVGGAAAI